jgi:hypothetical protein
MGSKRGYTRVLMELLGLSRHHPPAAFIWSDTGPNVAALATLAGARGDARDVAGWLNCQQVQYPGTEMFCASKAEAQFGGANGHGRLNRSPMTPDKVADTTDVLPLPRAPEVAAIIRTWKDEEPRALWERLKAAGWPSLMPPKGMRWGQPVLGRWLGPQSIQDVAGYLLKSTWSYEAGNAATGFCGPGDRRQDTSAVAVAVDRIGSARWPRVACYQGTATRLVEQLPERLDNVIAYLDPPYSGTTGYKFGGCPRSEVLRMALDLSARGATVAISEAVRLDRELGEGWTAVQIDGERKGQKRTFSVQQSEWVTMNRQPAHVPGQQQGLFGGAR